jgi:DNA mismatch repair ATPase MutS
MTVANFCFNSVLQKEKMIFNYELSKGICKDFNASELMKKSGIIILTNTEDIR